jgi:hypothetical protein
MNKGFLTLWFNLEVPKFIRHHFKGEIKISLVTTHFWVGLLGIAEAQKVRI